ncbi:MAG: type II secretion system protein N [Venatoribacter sp.]
MNQLQPVLTSWQRASLLIGKLVLTLFVGVQMAYLVWQIVAPEPLVLMAPTKASGGSQTLVSNTAQYHLFGEIGAEPVAQVTEEVAAPETRLRLQLLGVTKSTDDRSSSAIIAETGKAGEFYRIGERVQGGTKLAGVYENRVILDTNGKLETLKFDEESIAGVTAAAAPNPAPASNPALRNLPPRRGSLQNRLQRASSPTEFVSMISADVDSDPNGLLNEIGLEVTGDGQGYRVGANSMLRALQLQPGDIVLSVNGQMLGDPQSDQQLFHEISKESSVRVEVQRGNSRFVVNHSLN